MTTLVNVPSRLSKILPDVDGGSSTVVDLGHGARAWVMSEIERELQHLLVARKPPSGSSCRPMVLNIDLNGPSVFEVPIWKTAFCERVRLTVWCVHQSSSNAIADSYPHLECWTDTDATVIHVPLPLRLFSGSTIPDAGLARRVEVDLNIGASAIGDFGTESAFLRFDVDSSVGSQLTAIFGISWQTYNPLDLEV